MSSPTRKPGSFQVIPGGADRAPENPFSALLGNDREALDSALAELDSLLGSGISHDHALGAIAQAALQLTGAEGVAIALADGADVTCRASLGAIAPEVGATLNVASGLTGEAYRTGEVRHCHDAQTDTRVNAAICRELGVQSFLVVPVLRDLKPAGIIEVFHSEPFVFSHTDTDALSALVPFVLRAMDSALSRAAAPPAPAPVAAPVNPAAAAPQAVIAAVTGVPPAPSASAPALAPRGTPPVSRAAAAAAPAPATASPAPATAVPTEPAPPPRASKPAPEKPLAASAAVPITADQLPLAKEPAPAPKPPAPAASSRPAAPPPARRPSAAAASDALDSTPHRFSLLGGKYDEKSRSASSRSRASARLIVFAVVLVVLAGTTSVAWWKLRTTAAVALARPAVAPAAPAVAADKPGASPSPSLASQTAVSPASLPLAVSVSSASGKPADPVRRQPVARELATEDPGLLRRVAAPTGNGDAAPPTIATPVPGALSLNTISVVPAAAAPAPSQSKISEVREARLLERIDPTYPPAARQARVEGTVHIRGIITKTGQVRDARVIKGSPLLGPAALVAVRQWRYSPYYLNGAPQEVPADIVVNFKLPR